MAFKYMPAGDNKSTTVFGIAFERGKPVKVEDPHAVAKLRNNSEFEEVDGRTKAARKRGGIQTSGGVETTIVGNVIK